MRAGEAAGSRHGRAPRAALAAGPRRRCALSGGGVPAALGYPQRRLGPRSAATCSARSWRCSGCQAARPAPPPPPCCRRHALFMLDLYRAVAGDDDEDGGAPERRLGRADLVIGFVNMGERGPRAGGSDPGDGGGAEQPYGG